VTNARRAAGVHGGPAARLFLRVIFADGERIGPGKIDVLEAIGREHSISAAARALGMSYRRAWLLLDAMNKMFRQPVIVTRPGRAAGGSAEVTPFGNRVVRLYRDAERRANRECATAMRALTAERSE